MLDAQTFGRVVYLRSCLLPLPPSLYTLRPHPPLSQRLILRIPVTSHLVDRHLFLATGYDLIPFPTLPQGAARLSAPLSSRRSTQTPSTLRDPR